MTSVAPRTEIRDAPSAAMAELQLAKPRIWVLSEYFYPNEINTGYVMSEIAAGLQQQFDVRVISGPEANFLNGASAKPRERWCGIDIRRCRGTSFNRKSFAGRITNAVTLSLVIFTAAIGAVQRGDIVLVVTNPPFLPLLALLVKWLKRARLVVVVHDVYPEAAIAARLLDRNSLVARLMAVATRTVFRQSDRVVTLGRDMCQLVREKVGADRANCVVIIPNWAEHERVQPLPRVANPLLKQLGLQDKFVVLHAGNMGHVQDIELLARAAFLLRENQRVAFLFVGSGVKKQWLEDTVRAQHLSNVTLCQPQARDQQQIFLNACDIAVLALVDGMGGVSVPSRLYSQMAAAKPWIAAVDADSEVAAVIGEERIGWVVPTGDADALAHAIEAAAADPELCQLMGERAREAAVSRYRLLDAVTAYQRLMATV